MIANVNMVIEKATQIKSGIMISMDVIAKIQ